MKPKKFLRVHKQCPTCGTSITDPWVLFSKIKKHVSMESDSGCWIWKGSLTYGGYAHLTWNGTLWVGHRLIYEIFKGPIPPGLELDHLCRVRRCVNPDHVEPVTHKVNVLRGLGVTAEAAQATHCPSGHSYDETNTLWSKDKRRYCRQCLRARAAQWARGKYENAPKILCKCGCGELISSLSLTGGRKRVGYIRGHNFRKLA